jgi:hypothetical protein
MDGDRRVLQAGMVFHLVPVLFEPDSVGFSALVHITETGA